MLTVNSAKNTLARGLRGVAGHVSPESSGHEKPRGPGEVHHPHLWGPWEAFYCALISGASTVTAQGTGAQPTPVTAWPAGCGSAVSLRTSRGCRLSPEAGEVCGSSAAQGPVHQRRSGATRVDVNRVTAAQPSALVILPAQNLQATASPGSEARATCPPNS